MPGHPADQLGSCFADLVGARLVGFSTGPLRAALPRLTSAEVFGAVKLPRVAPAEDLAGVPIVELIRVGAEAVGAERLGGRESSVVRARATVAHLAARDGYRQDRVAQALGTTPRSVQRLLALAPSAEIEAAVRMQVALGRAIAGA